MPTVRTMATTALESSNAREWLTAYRHGRRHAEMSYGGFKAYWVADGFGVRRWRKRGRVKAHGGVWLFGVGNAVPGDPFWKLGS